MPERKDPKEIYVNDLNTTLKDAIKKMSKKSISYSRHYGEEMNKFLTTPAVKGLLKTKAETMSISQIKEQIRKKLNKAYPNFEMGKMPIKCIDGKIRHYKPDPWCFMVARTASRDFREMGLHQEMVKAGLDLVIISIGGSNDPCRNWEGKICSITGETKDYPYIEDVRATGEIFHNNCVHSSSPYMLYKEDTGEIGVLGRDMDDYEMVLGEHGNKVARMKERFRKETVERIEEPPEILNIDRNADSKKFQAYLAPKDLEQIPDQKYLQTLLEGQAYKLAIDNPQVFAKIEHIRKALGDYTANGYYYQHKIDIGLQKKKNPALLFTKGTMPPYFSKSVNDTKLTRAFLSKAPKYTEGPLIRTVNELSNEDIANLTNLKAGDKWQFRSYVSFAKEGKKFHANPRLTFHLQEPINSGVDVSKISYHPNEKEVILVKQDFYISKIEKKTTDNLHIWLSEKKIPKGGNPIVE